MRTEQKIKLKQWDNKYISFDGETFNCYIHWKSRELVMPFLSPEELLSSEWEIYNDEE